MTAAIPEDIRRAAEDAFNEFEGWGRETAQAWDRRADIETIARALQDERERCAKVAEKTHAPFTAFAIRNPTGE